MKAYAITEKQLEQLRDVIQAIRVLLPATAVEIDVLALFFAQAEFMNLISSIEAQKLTILKPGFDKTIDEKLKKVEAECLKKQNCLSCTMYKICRNENFICARFMRGLIESYYKEALKNADNS